MDEKTTARVKELKARYRLAPHPEGGHYREAYTSPFEQNGRPIAGSIYFLLGRGEFSRLHEIDCDEIWYYHEGCGMRIISLTESGMEKIEIGPDRAMAAIPAGAVFAAENIDPDGYTFVSCVTAPKFSQEGFSEVTGEDVERRFAKYKDEASRLAF